MAIKAHAAGMLPAHLGIGSNTSIGDSLPKQSASSEELVPGQFTADHQLPTYDEILDNPAESERRIREAWEERGWSTVERGSPGGGITGYLKG